MPRSRARNRHPAGRPLPASSHARPRARAANAKVSHDYPRPHRAADANHRVFAPDAIRDGGHYKRNLSADNLVAQPDGTLAARASFGPLETVSALPSRSDLSGVRLLTSPAAAASTSSTWPAPIRASSSGPRTRTFEPLQRFAALPALDWSDPNVKFIDVTGDGLADILMTEDGLFTFYASLGGDAGFGTARLVRPGWDEEKGPSVVFADGTRDHLHRRHVG